MMLGRLRQMPVEWPFAMVFDADMEAFDLLHRRLVMPAIVWLNCSAFILSCLQSYG
jgi:hypothetical protein